MLVHGAMTVLTIVLAALTGLAKIDPAWAAPLAVGIALVTDFQAVLRALGNVGATPTKTIVLLLALGLAGNVSCAHPQPGAPGVIQCSTDAIQKCAPGALPSVNACLVGEGDITSCLLGLIQPAGCVTYNVIACLVRHEGREARDSAAVNPSNLVDARRWARAREFLDKEHPTFAD